MATKASVFLCSFLLAILLIPSLTSARELLLVHDVVEPLKPGKPAIGGARPGQPYTRPYTRGNPYRGGRPGQPYNRGMPYYRPSPPDKPITHGALKPDKPAIGGARPGQPYTHGKPYNPTP